jgi:hypothetical protein
MSGLPYDRDETLGLQSTCEGSLLDRIQQAIVDLHENEYRGEQTFVVIPGEVQTDWGYDGTGHYHESSAGGQYILMSIDEMLPPGCEIKSMFIMQYRPSGSALQFQLSSIGLDDLGEPTDQVIHGVTYNEAVVDDWELVELKLAADVDNDPDSPLVTSSYRSYVITAFSTASGERVGAFKFVIEMRRS